MNHAKVRASTILKQSLRSKIKTELEDTDIFILLYTGVDEDWSYCMWECGRFENFINSSDKKSIVVMHDNSINPPSVLQIYKSLPVVENEIRQFINEIYITEWKVRPQVNPKTLQNIVQEITMALDKPVVINFDLVPNFGIKIPLSEKNLDILGSSIIPPDALVTGSQGWQRFFGKDIDTGGWFWSNLTEGWLKKKLYEYEFSRMIRTALRNDSPNGCLLKVEGETLYYINLSRYERIVGNGAGTFMFSAFKIDTPIYSVKGSAAKEEVICYNILNICWYARRMLVDELYPHVLNLLIKPTSDAQEAISVLKKVRNELNSISVQCEIRDLNNLISNKEIFDIETLINDNDIWSNIQNAVLDERNNSSPDFINIAKALFSLAKMNVAYYKETSKKFAEFANGLSLPEPPDSYIKYSEDRRGRPSDTPSV